MKKMKHLLAALLLIGASGIMTAGACDSITEACGPCGLVSNGDTTISGDAALDGFFQAVGDMNMTTGSINADFNAQVMDLAVAFDVDVSAYVEGTMTFEALIDEIVGEITATLNASIEGGIDGGLTLAYTPPKCEVSVEASFEAQAQCEAKAECEVDAECQAGNASFECSGTCSGSCSADCDFPVCTVELDATLQCSGECSGKCSIEASGTCEGECHGECDAECSAYVDDGAGGFECAGTCSGNCTGECHAEVEGECSGECHGSCVAEATADVSCSGEVSCQGECGGECSGGCEGEVTPPSCSVEADCEASADCQAQAEASASANASCQPPSLELSYNLSASLQGEANAAAKAKFMGQIKAFRIAMIGMLQGIANLRILVDANAAAEIGIEPPAITLLAEFNGLVNTALDGDFNISAGLIPCVVPALQETVQILGAMPAEVEATISGQVKFLTIIGLN